MCYKEKVQAQYAKKLEKRFIEDKTPEFIQDYFIRLSSEATKLNNYIKIKSMFTWMIDNGHISKSSISEITPDNMNNITLTHAIKYLDNLKNSGLEGSTVATYKNVLSGFFSYLVDDRYIESNIIHKIPSKKYKSRKKPVKLPVGNSLDMFILNVLNDVNEHKRYRNFAIIKLFLGSGIRVSELVGLDLDDLHFDCTEPYVIILAKGEQDEDFKEEIPVSESAVKAIQEYIKIRNKFYTNSREKGVFLSADDSRLTKDGVTYLFETYSNKEITPHMLRHYVGTKLYEFSGNDINAVKNQLGHADVNTSLNSYVATNNSKRYKALNMI